jgi:hypothetical protein
LLTASVVHSVDLDHDWILIDAPTLAHLMEQRESLKALTLRNLTMDENHCRVLGAYSRPGLDIVLVSCKLTSAGTRALAEVIGRNQGPTRLDSSGIDYSVLANGFRGNTRLKSLRARMWSSRKLLAIADALKENKGLVDLNLGPSSTMSDETWDVVCDSLKTQPTLEILNLPAALVATRIQALVDMMKANMSIHTIRLDDHDCEHELFRESVVPYLKTNRFRPRLLAIQKTPPTTYRAKVLGRALLSSRTDANSFWMLLSGNPEVAFPSTTATTTPAANLPPTSAIADGTSNALAVAASTAAVSVTATWDTLTAGISAAATGRVATPTACQKRKARR